MTAPLASSVALSRQQQLVSALEYEIFACVRPTRLVEAGADNHGAALEAYLADAIHMGRWSPSQPWCAIWATTVIRKACARVGVVNNPVPLTASCSELGAWAKRKGALFDRPSMLALHLIASGDPSHPYHHTGFVIDSNEGRIRDGKLYGLSLVDGNTNQGQPPSKNGYGVFERYGDPASPSVIAGGVGHERVFRLGVDKFVHFLPFIILE